MTDYTDTRLAAEEERVRLLKQEIERLEAERDKARDQLNEVRLLLWQHGHRNQLPEGEGVCELCDWCIRNRAEPER